MTEFRDHSDDALPPRRPLQRRAVANSLIPLEGAAGRQAARRLERIAADADVITELQLTNFDTGTPEWRSFAEALAEYGYAVFKGWLILGKARLIVSQHANGQGVRGIGKIPEGLKLSPDDAHALAADLAMVSIDSFRRRTLMHENPAKRWSPTGGANIKTFFIGRCKMEFPDAYKRWEKTVGRADRIDEADLLPNPRNVADEHALARARLAEVLADADPVVVDMFEYHDLGYTYAQIAAILSDEGNPTTETQVGTVMSRFRKSIQRKHA